MSQALESMFRKHYTWFLNYAKKQLGDDHYYMGDDMVQEAFSRVLASYGDKDDEKEVQKLLFRTIRNLVFDFHSASYVRFCVSLSDDEEDSEDVRKAPVRPEEFYDPELDNMVYLKELRAKIDEGLERMPSQQKTCIVTRYLQDNTLAETSRLLNLAHGTVTNHLSRGKAFLMCALEDFRP